MKTNVSWFNIPFASIILIGLLFSITNAVYGEPIASSPAMRTSTLLAPIGQNLTTPEEDNRLEIVQLDLAKIVEASPKSEAVINNVHPTVSPAAEKDWEFRLTPYVFLNDFKGTETIRGYTSPTLDIPFSKLLNALDVFAAGRAEVWHRHNGIYFDGYYSKISPAVDTTILVPPGTYVQGRTIEIPAGRFRMEKTLVIPPGPGVDVPGPKFNMNNIAGFYQLGLSHRFAFYGPAGPEGNHLFVEPQAGLRLAYIQQGLTTLPGPLLSVSNAPGRSFSGSKTYVEPVVGSNLEYQFSKRLSVSVRGTIGGFGLLNGSHFSWNLIPTLGIQLSKCSILNLGYGITDINYGTGSGKQAFSLNARLQGPWISMTFKF